MVPRIRNQVSGPVVDIEQFLHDIRSPLGALKIFLDGSDSQENIGLIKMCAERIEDMVLKLMPGNESQCETISFPEPLTSTLLTKCIYEVILEKSAELNQPISFQRSAESDLVFSKIQRMEFKRLLSNLMNNSFEACTQKSEREIKLRTFCVSDRFVIEISDNGHGIAPEKIEHIFKRGFSTKNSSGLGLSHAKETIRSWNGDLKILSWPNHGTTVVISLPIPPSQS